MDPDFKAAVDSLHLAFERLRKSVPYKAGAHLPKQGAYLFCDNGKAMYVGRSNNVPQRRRQHTAAASQINRAALATLIARKETNTDIDYRKGAREKLLANPEFTMAFAKAKGRVRAMEFRAVEECDQTRQALLEIYCAIALKAEHNDFGTH